MYPPPDHSAYQAKLIVNLVVAVFLIIGFMLVLQYFNFVYLREIPLIGDWLMDIYERVFGVPRVLILHGDDSLGDWVALRDELSGKLIFYSDELDVRKFSAGLGDKLGQYGLVIVEDAKTLDKDKLINLDDYVQGGGNLIWVGDAGTQGVVDYQGNVLDNQTGWIRDVVCIDQNTLLACDCKAAKVNSTCRYLPDETEQERLDFTNILGVTFNKNLLGPAPGLEIVDRAHWVAVGVKPMFVLENVSKITSVENKHTTALVANLNMSGASFPGLIVNDLPGAWGAVIYFSYPPEETMEILMPIVERLRY